MNTFAEVTHALRKSAGLTLEAVAKRLKTHKGYVSGYEHAKVNPPSVAIVRRIFKLFEPQLANAGIKATELDLVELAWVSKAPALIRARALGRLVDNPLATARITRPQPPEELPPQPAVQISPAPAAPEPAREAV